MAGPADRNSTFADLSPYAAAVAVVRTIAELSEERLGEEIIWQSFARWRGNNQVAYIEAIRKTQHSIFYYQLQHLYEFGIEKVPAQSREDFCYLCGRTFLKTVLAETIFPLLQVAMAKPGSFQATVVDMVRMYLNRFGGNKYLLDVEIQAEEIVLNVEDREPEQVRAYLQQYGLNVDRCFRSSAQFIAGAMREFLEQIVDKVEPQAVPCQVRNGRGTVRLPLREDQQFGFERLLGTMMQCMQQVQLRQRAKVEEQQLESELVLGSPVMCEAWKRIRRASESDELVLLLGESGTGKTFIAKKIHELSRRREGPFISVGLTSDIGSENLIQSNLFGHEKGAFTGATEQKQGLFSLADGGTIFLDEIGDASAELQAKLLRVIETSTFKRLGGVKDLHVDVRVIAATHRNLEQLVREGEFREDLYYRLNVIPMRVPALRERPEAIPALVQYFLGRLNRSSRGLRRQISANLLQMLQLYSWPGNVRELEHAVKHAFAMSDGAKLNLLAFPERIREFLAGKQSTAAGERKTSQVTVIDTALLRRLIRETDPTLMARSGAPHTTPCHIEFAKCSYLASLIQELNGDLGLIGQFWDHGSEKTLRSLIRSYGLCDMLEEVRARSRSSRKGVGNPASGDLPRVDR